MESKYFSVAFVDFFTLPLSNVTSKYFTVIKTKHIDEISLFNLHKQLRTKPNKNTNGNFHKMVEREKYTRQKVTNKETKSIYRFYQFICYKQNDFNCSCSIKHKLSLLPICIYLKISIKMFTRSHACKHNINIQQIK